jgi:hypothetical protein
MPQMPSKARELTIAGVIMSVTALGWYVAPLAKLTAAGFIAAGLIMLARALYLWLKPHA